MDVPSHRRRYYPKLRVPHQWMVPMDLSGLPHRLHLVSELHDPEHPLDAAAIQRETDIFQEEQHVHASAQAHLAWQSAQRTVV